MSYGVSPCQLKSGADQEGMDQPPCRRSSSRVGASGLVKSESFTKQDGFLPFTHVLRK